MNAPVPNWQRRGYSVAAMRGLARAALPRPIFDFADGGAEDERTLRRNEAVFGEIELLPMPLNGAATRDLSVELFGKRISMPLVIGAHGSCRPVLAQWRTGERAGGARRRHRHLSQPWFGLHHRGSGGEQCFTALDAGLHLQGSRFHARIDGARAEIELRCAGSHHRQPDARQSRARHPQRLRHPAALQPNATGRHGPQGAVAVAHAEGIPAHHLRQLCAAGRARRSESAGRAHGLAARSRHVMGRRRQFAQAMAGAAHSQGRAKPSRSETRARSRH